MIVGVLGLGRIGAIHAANLASLADVELVVFDPDPSAVQRVTEATGARSLPDRDALIAARVQEPLQRRASVDDGQLADLRAT